MRARIAASSAGAILALLCLSCSPEPTKQSSMPSPAAATPVLDAVAPEPDAPPTEPSQGADDTAPSPSTDNSTAPNDGTHTFHGYACTDDCSGHQAGYDWAEEHGVTDPDSCGGNSQSFIEGCKAFAGEDGPDGDGDDTDGNGD